MNATRLPHWASRFLWQGLALAVFMGVAVGAACRTEPARPGAAAPGAGVRPRLLVVLVVDQMRADFVDRFRGEWQGGLARLLDEGILYRDAHHDNAFTVTAAGHALIFSGKHPRSHGIIGNTWYDRASKERIEAIEDRDQHNLGLEGPGASPRWLRASTLADWLREAEPEARVLSLSRKDRAAVLMAGRGAEHVYWYEKSLPGATTSTFYRTSLPDFVTAFNARGLDRELANSTWSLMRGEAAGYEGTPDDVHGENESFFGDRVFPHAVPRGEGEPLGKIKSLPGMDAWELALARDGVLGLGLGTDDVPDLLAISLSATDAIGHLFGPDSLEQRDNLLRLDAELGAFFAFLDEHVGLDRTVIVLTGDHGVAPLPELARVTLGRTDAARVSSEEIESRVSAAIDRALGGSGGYVQAFIKQNLWLDRTLLEVNGISLERAAEAAVAALEAESCIARALLPAAFEGPANDQDPLIERWKRSYIADRSGDVIAIWREYCVDGDDETRTNHGSPYDYDTHVPLVVRVPGRAPASVDRFVSMVDVAPTLARLLGIDAPADLDGSVIEEFAAVSDSE